MKYVVQHDDDEDTSFGVAYALPPRENYSKKKASSMVLVEGLDVPYPIAERASAIFDSMKGRSRKGRKRRIQAYYCIYCAYLERGDPVDAIELGKRCGLTGKEIAAADSLFSPLKTGYKPPYPMSAAGFLEIYTRSGPLSDTPKDLLYNILDSACGTEPGLLAYKPQVLACGVLEYYVRINGITLTQRDSISSTTGISKSVVEDACHDVAIAHNNGSDVPQEDW